MGLMTRPSKNIDLSKIDDIQDEYFGEKDSNDTKNTKVTKTTKATKLTKKAADEFASAENEKSSDYKTAENSSSPQDAKITRAEVIEVIKSADGETKKSGSESLKIADLLTTAKIEGVRHTSRPFTVPRSLTIDLTRLKSKFRNRDLQYTQNELMDKMVRESLEIVTAENYFSLRENAFKLVKSPEQCSRRTVTLTEETVSEMAELKADLSLKHNRRISADEVFTTLLAIAFAPLYENNLV